LRVVCVVRAGTCTRNHMRGRIASGGGVGGTAREKQNIDISCIIVSLRSLDIAVGLLVDLTKGIAECDHSRGRREAALRGWRPKPNGQNEPKGKGMARKRARGGEARSGRFTHSVLCHTRGWVHLARRLAAKISALLHGYGAVKTPDMVWQRSTCRARHNT
jgi:hypothetical protein